LQDVIEFLAVLAAAIENLMGAVIRQAERETAHRREVGGTLFSFADLERQAREILARARAEASRLLSDAEARAEQVALKRHAEGYQRGLTEGRRRGLEEVRREARQAAVQAAQAELKKLSGALTTGLAEYERQRHGLIAQAESGLIELALAIARRVCKVHMDASIEPVRANIRALLEMVAPHADCALRVSPADYERLAEVLPALIQRTAQFEHVTLQPDPAVARGACVLQTRGGVLDASVDGQLDRIAAAIGAGATSEPTE
jgi:flagellar biosynthesis/type III secretory pathway protein FliH